MRIELQHITKRFGQVFANDNVSITIEAGSIHGLLGENGAGKSTIVKVLSGFISRDSGTVLFDGQVANIKTPSDAICSGVGMLHQDPLDFPPLSVLDNFVVGRSEVLAKGLFSGLKFIQIDRARQEFLRLSETFNFSLNPDDRVSDLTVGERQQLEIIRLLSLGVKTLILDEPTTGISASQKTALFDAARRLASEGKSVIFVSHKLEDVEELCDRVTVMRSGKVVGNVEIPCPDSVLIDLIFGKKLAPPIKPNTKQPEPMLELRNIVVKDDRLTLKIGDFTADKGEVIGLAGLEGSGQQLLLLLCAGLMRASTGSISIDKLDMTQKPYLEYLKHGIGYSPADRLKDGLIRGLSIHEHVILRKPNQKLFIDWKETHQNALEAIAMFDIRGKPNSRVERLSGGNQQRTQLALLPVPLNLLLMEHPTRGLDIESTLWVWQQLIARCETGTTVLFMSSDLDEIMQYSDRVLVFSGGQVSDAIATSKLTVEKLGQMIGGRFAEVGIE
jgi:general nucleoside transport system ATP-binding protein